MVLSQDMTASHSWQYNMMSAYCFHLRCKKRFLAHSRTNHSAQKRLEGLPSCVQPMSMYQVLSGKPYQYQGLSR